MNNTMSYNSFKRLVLDGMIKDVVIINEKTIKIYLSEIYAINVDLENTWDSMTYLGFFFKEAVIEKVVFSRSVERFTLKKPPSKIKKDISYREPLQLYRPKPTIILRSKQGHTRSLISEHFFWFDRIKEYYKESQLKFLSEEPIFYTDKEIDLNKDYYIFIEGFKRSYAIERKEV